ncbi:hypothetical protein ABT040_08840 [Streptomyces sp. NPDC002688]|uniref:hypothetical protein n=1 Tax=Streptomyces sp. NPDC002688 TaxID=3154423 RepID=UPI003318EB87
MSTSGALRAGPIVTAGTFGRTHADRPAGETAVHDPLLLPGNTVVPSGHGSDRTVAAQRPGVPAT